MLSLRLNVFIVAAILSFVNAAPADRGNVKVTLQNNCDFDLNVGKLDNGQSYAENSHLPKSSSKTYHLHSHWQGRFWGRENCTTDCAKAGAAHPASLAEFTFKGYAGNDFYDVSFVDGYNVPMRIEPNNVSDAADDDNHYHCGAPACVHLPECPSELKHFVNGQYVGCKSACSQFDTEEYCCYGSMDTPETCPINKYAKQVKDVCPDVYTYAYDDPTSTFICQAQSYTVTFCPAE